MRSDTGARNYRHGHAARGGLSSEYQSWKGMKNRCRQPSHIGYKYYGARGIEVCERWNQFENFIADMGLKPTPKHTLDRIDPNGNYEPGNCRWSTPQEQRRNQRPQNDSWRVRRSWETGKRSRVSNLRTDLAGQIFGKLTVLPVTKEHGGRLAWLCKCECGAEKFVVAKSLRNGSTKSCGCNQLIGIKTAACARTSEEQSRRAKIRWAKWRAERAERGR